MGELYSRYGNICYSVILRIVGNHHIAEDLLQETFLQVWTRTHLYEPSRGELRSWIIVIAKNKAIDYLRSSTGRIQSRSIGSNRLDHFPLAASESPSRSHDDGFSSVKAAFHRLSKNQRTVLTLAYVQGMSQSEIAEALKQPLGTVKTWARSALHVLRGEVQAIRSAQAQPRRPERTSYEGRMPQTRLASAWATGSMLKSPAEDRPPGTGPNCGKPSRSVVQDDTHQRAVNV